MSSVAVVMPTIPRREASARDTINRLLPQCDRFYVHLDGYAKVPSWIPSQLRCFLYPQSRGPAVRFSVVPDEDYVLFVDDDFSHPSNYVKHSIEALTRTGPKTAIAYHASWWPPGVPPNYRHRKTVSYGEASSNDCTVTYVGSGTLGLRAKDFRSLDRSIPDSFHFEDDVWISGALARAGMRCVRPKTSKDWLRASNPVGNSLWKQAVKDEFKRRDMCISTALALGGWKLTP